MNNQANNSNDNQVEQKEPINQNQAIPDNIYKIFSYLYLSSFGATKQYNDMKAMGITNIINVANNTSPTKEQKEIFDLLYLPLPDTHNFNIIPAVKQCGNHINLLQQNNKKCIVNCNAGISRSSTIIIGYIMIHKKKSLKEAYEYVKKCKKNISPNPGFMKQLVKLEKEIFNTNVSSLNLQNYVVDLLHGVFSTKSKNEIKKILSDCNGDYLAAQNVLFQML